MILNLAGKLKRKPSGGEWAWFLEEKSEPRNKLVFLAGENQRADVSASLPVASFFMNNQGLYLKKDAEGLHRKS
jgi:hypothetical protein